MNRTQPLDQVRSIVASALNRTAKIRKNFESFFMETMILILTIYGKVNFLSMARHGDSCESRFRQNFKKKFDWCAFNSNMLLEVNGHRTAVALDHSFLSKSGKKTTGLGSYWAGSAGTVKRGIEILGFAQLVAGASDARFLFAVQTLPQTTKGRTPFYLEHMKDRRDNQTAKCLRVTADHREQLLAISDILVGDCLFASYNFVTGAEKLGFSVISRLRDDAVLHYLYTGPQKDGRGRPKELDGIVDIRNLRDDVFVKESVDIDGRKVTLFSDAKQNTGLEDWQSRDADRLSFGYNASLTAVNVAREMADDMEKATGRRLSVASVKKVLHNVALYQHIREFIEGLKSVDPQINFTLSEEIPDKLLFFGVRDSA